MAGAGARSLLSCARVLDVILKRPERDIQVEAIKALTTRLRGIPGQQQVIKEVTQVIK